MTSAYLEVQVEIDKNVDKISLSQPYLIQRIMDTLLDIEKELLTKGLYWFLIHQKESNAS